MHHFCKKHNDSIILPTNLHTIHMHQTKSDKKYKNEITNKFKDISLKVKENTNQIFIPASFEEDLTKWYYQNLKHPSSDRIYLIMKETFYWKGMKNYIKEHVKICSTY